jgi:hypothetical protein
MKVTLSAAMRARDVSQPRPEDEEAARKADSQPPAAKGRPERAERSERPERTESSGRPTASRNNRGRRKRR